MVEKRTDWRDASACLDEDPELFFPIGDSGPALEQIAEAKAVCAGCPVVEECREYALAHPALTDHGVWGGASEDERRSELRRHRRRGDAAGVAA
ncbi:MAG TPA: WhiB family transcriptional regulator [Kineosporiaceae bacterium]|nr:WhiB family transcriptional regulator [Kineosporiaceae bacterium]